MVVMRNGIVAGEPGMFPWPRWRLLRWLSGHRHPAPPQPDPRPVSELDPKRPPA